jgi:hypothetical protein
MDKPTSVAIGGFNYFNSKHLKEYDQVFYHGTSRSHKHIISRKTIPSLEYFYAGYSKRHGWLKSKDQANPPNRAHLLLSEKWVIANVPKMMSKPERAKNALEDDSDCVGAPPLLILKEEEKFHDNDGKVFNIETRGRREPGKVLFYAKDVSAAFDMPNLRKTLMNVERGYIRNKHYNVFVSGKVINDYFVPHKSLFITYKGMLKILFSSRCGKAESFLDWATKTLFAAQMGTTDQKQELVSSILGIPAKSMQEMLKKTESVPCIYLFAFGTAKTLRTSMSLSDDVPDDHIIVKCGRTNDLRRRTGEHLITYGDIGQMKLELMHYVYVDPKYTAEAESEIKDFFKFIETPLDYKNHTELFAIEPTHLTQIKRQFTSIHHSFAGNVKELTSQIEKLQRDCKDKDTQIKHIKEAHTWALKDKDRVIEVKDCTIKLKDKDIEVLKLKNQIMQLQAKK